jgi:hypothetical protein
MDGQYMKQGMFGARSLGLVASIATMALVPAQAQATTAANYGNPSGCPSATAAQAFLSWGDSNWYTQVPGQRTTGFAGGAGWVLSGGAKIVTTRLAEGSAGTVLDLPSGAQAVSPTICVTSDDPDARAVVRDVAGAGGLSVTVSYGAKDKHTGNLKASGSTWGLTATANLHTNPIVGGVPVTLTLTPSGKGTEEQVYDLEVDPRFGR